MDTERGGTIMATSWHVRKRVLLISKIDSFVWPTGCCRFDLVSVFKELSAGHNNVHVAFVWGDGIRSKSL